jgi:hypothetical protein
MGILGGQRSKYHPLELDGIDDEEHIRTTRIDHYLGISRMLFGTRLRAKKPPRRISQPPSARTEVRNSQALPEIFKHRQRGGQVHKECE